MNCPNCGNENRSEAKFCRFCGQTLPADTSIEEILLSAPSLTEPDSSVHPVEVPSPVDPYAAPTLVPPSPIKPSGEDTYATVIVNPEELFTAAPVISSSVNRPEEELPETDQNTGDIPASLEPSDVVEPEPVVIQAESDIAPFDQVPEPIDSPGISEKNEPDQVASEGSNNEVEEPLPAPDTQPVQVSLLIHQPGTILLERYRIVSLITEDPGFLLYQAEDLQTCWNCSWLQGDPDPHFCEHCGVELTDHPALELRQMLRQAIEGPDVFHLDAFTYRVEPGASVEPPAQAAQVAGYFAGYASDTGRQREIDEDSVLVLQLAGLCNRCSGPTLGFFAIADGIGGQDAGEVASRTAVHILAESILQNIFLPVVKQQNSDLSPDNVVASLQEKMVQAVISANQAIIDLRNSSPNGSNMGCTLTAALLYDTTCLIANVGDSRTYLLHASQLTQITRDHSVVADMIASGEISTEEALTHDKKSVIYRCLGDLPGLEVDTFQLEIQPGDRLLLCCDGLWEMVPDGLIEDILLQYTDPQAACQRLVSLANEAGGEDNISVVTVNIQSVT